jgi:hypothetical protein
MRDALNPATIENRISNGHDGIRPGRITAIDVQRVEDLLNNRPRKALNYHSNNEVFAKLTDPLENYALGM